jgi:hypothetical protein
MREMPVKEPIFPGAQIRDDGRVTMDFFLFQAKSPAELKISTRRLQDPGKDPCRAGISPAQPESVPVRSRKAVRRQRHESGLHRSRHARLEDGTNVQPVGHTLTVHDVSSLAGPILVANGATWVDSPRAVAEQADFVPTSLPGPRQVKMVALGVQGVLAGLRPDCPNFDLSTNSPSTIRSIEAAYAERERQFLDTPVSGRPAAALQRKLTLWVSGDAETAARFKPIVEAVGAKLLYVGPIGTAAIPKFVNNCASFGLTALLA